MGGLEVELALKPFVTHMTQRAHNSRTATPVTFNSVIVTVDPDTGRALSIERLDLRRDTGHSLEF